MSAECVFCGIVAGDIPCSPVHEDEKILAFLDVNPVTEGHTLIIPKQHYETLPEAPHDVLAEISRAMRDIAPAVAEATGSDGFNIHLCNGAAAGQVVPHIHFHVIPRKANDDLGLRWRAGKYAEGRMDEVHAAIRAEMRKG